MGLSSFMRPSINLHQASCAEGLSPTFILTSAQRFELSEVIFSIAFCRISLPKSMLKRSDVVPPESPNRPARLRHQFDLLHAIFQNFSHRRTVRSEMRNSLQSATTDLCAPPVRSRLNSKSTPALCGLRPAKRTDRGLDRFRQPSLEQHNP